MAIGKIFICAVLNILTLSHSSRFIHPNQRAYVPAVGETLESFANTLTAGVNIMGAAQIVPTYNDNGK